MPDLFWAMSQWIVSSKAADILRQHDLGGGALYPVSDGVFQKDGKTRVPGDYFCWVFGNTKSAFLAAETPSVQPLEAGTEGLWRLPAKLSDGAITVARLAMSGPEIWLDPTLFKSVFLSRPLGDALEQAGLHTAFRLFKCRVI